LYKENAPSTVVFYEIADETPVVQEVSLCELT